MPTAVLFSKPLPDYLLALLAQKVPAYGMQIVSELVRKHDFAFRFAASRRSKLGDFTRTASGQVMLTVNADLAPELFLVTFLHEVAHLQATENRKRREPPHGIRWQNAFGLLLQTLCSQAEGSMAVPLRDALLAHSKAPTATLHADEALAGILLPAVMPDTTSNEGMSLVERLRTGMAFSYRGRAFLMSGKLSKRHYATELQSGKLYSFSSQCRVRIVEHANKITADIRLGSELSPGQLFVHRSRRFRLDQHLRSRMLCTDLATGKQVHLHGLMHVAV
jgi:hypothetical protein